MALEAFQLGLPVVATNVGVLPEIAQQVRGRDVAIRIPFNATGEVIAAAARLAHARRNELGENGKAYSRSWTAEQMTAEYDRLIDES